ncbi:lysoplasmalogenase protein TMEM86A [Biomphalaria glabrata]|nr:lysoplasmalogenase protein TMEM86A [Biomphalaria glabrata]
MESYLMNFKFKSEVVKLLKYLTKPSILPFYVFVVIYLVVFSPHVARPDEVPFAALLKVLPIWYLAFYVYKARNTRSNWDAEDSYSALNLNIFLCGLLMSSLGDICLVYENLFQPGVVAFAVAQFCYLLNFKRLYKTYLLAWSSIPIGIMIYIILFISMQDVSMKIIVFFYNILIHTMLFYAFSCFESKPCAATLSIMLGASIFLISDFTIAVNKWIISFSLAEGIILSTYYVAQLLLTVGVTNVTKEKI